MLVPVLGSGHEDLVEMIPKGKGYFSTEWNDSAYVYSVKRHDHVINRYDTGFFGDLSNFPDERSEHLIPFQPLTHKHGSDANSCAG